MSFWAGLARASVLAGAAALAVASGSAGAVRRAAAQASANVVVVPGFAAPHYGGTYGVPDFPASASELSRFHFSQLAADAVTPAALQPYDTAIFYGVRWSDLAPAAQAAVNAFARTGKVLIWDADGTGAQRYASFVQPFATAASGENGAANDSVVSFPAGGSFLARPQPGSASFLDPAQLVSDRNLLNDMNAMATGTPGWAPALVAANKDVPQGGWPIAWTYGAIGDHSGLVVYSGLDADAFTDDWSPNYAIRALALQLAAPFLRAPDPACSPRCAPPAVGAQGPTFAACSFVGRTPRAWQRGRVRLTLATSVAHGIAARVVGPGGRVDGTSRTLRPGRLRLLVDTRRLPSNRASRVQALVYFRGTHACTATTRLKVDNVSPRLLRLRTSTAAAGRLVALRASERSWLRIVARGVHRERTLIAARREIEVVLPASTTRARLILTDRAGNRTVRTLVW
jgi:hypothetical protein